MSNVQKLDCCFLVCGNSKKTYQELSKTYSAIEPPTWALLLAESTRVVGFNVKLLTLMQKISLKKRFILE